MYLFTFTDGRVPSPLHTAADAHMTSFHVFQKGVVSEVFVPSMNVHRTALHNTNAPKNDPKEALINAAYNVTYGPTK